MKRASPRETVGDVKFVKRQMDVVIVEENLNCPKCIEQAKIIQRLRAQNTQLLAALSAAQNETASIPRSGDSSPV